MKDAFSFKDGIVLIQSSSRGKKVNDLGFFFVSSLLVSPLISGIIGWMKMIGHEEERKKER
jgi:integral membrane sensor domain MASE1